MGGVYIFMKIWRMREEAQYIYEVMACDERKIYVATKVALYVYAISDPFAVRVHRRSTAIARSLLMRRQVVSSRPTHRRGFFFDNGISIIIPLTTRFVSSYSPFYAQYFACYHC